MSVEKFIQAAQRAAKQAEADEYTKEQQRRYDLYQGLFAPHVRAILQELMPNTWKEIPPKWVNVYRLAIDRRAGAMYEPAPKRTFTQGGEPVSDDLRDRIERLYKRARANVLLDKAARYVEMHRTIIVGAVWRHERVELEVRPPMEFHVIQGYPDPTSLDDAEALILPATARVDTPERADQELRTIWSQHADSPLAGGGAPQWVTVDGRGRVVDSGDNPYIEPTEGGGNRWILPAALLHAEDPDARLLLPGGEDLAEGALHVAFEESDMAYIARFQSFGVPVFKGADGKNQTIAPSKGVNVPEGGDFDFKAPPGKLKERRENLNAFIAELAVTWDLPADTFDYNKQPQSGISRRIASAALVEARKRNTLRARDHEKEVWRVMRAVHNAHSAPKERIPFDVELETAFAPQELPLDPTEQAEADARDVEMGKVSVVDLIMRDEGVSREEAQERYSENLRLKPGSAKGAIGLALADRLAQRRAEQGAGG